METILTGNIWKQVAQYARAAKRRLLAVAYVSSDSHLRLKRDDVLVCDASERAIRAGETSAQLLRGLSRRGVELRSRPYLHAKVAVFGQYALIGSCNLSTSSEKDLTELALLTDRKQVVAQATAFIHGLRETSAEIDNDFLANILRIKVRLSHRRGGKGRERSTKFGTRVWIVSVRELPPDSFPKEQPLVDKAERKAHGLVADRDATISWIRWTGKTRFRDFARPGDMVVQIWKSVSGKRITVLAPCPVVLRQEVGHWTRFYLVEPKRLRKLSWDRFRKEGRRFGLFRISKDSVRELNSREALLIEGMWK